MFTLYVYDESPELEFHAIYDHTKDMNRHFAIDTSSQQWWCQQKNRKNFNHDYHHQEMSTVNGSLLSGNGWMYGNLWRLNGMTYFSFWIISSEKYSTIVSWAKYDNSHGIIQNMNDRASSYRLGARKHHTHNTCPHFIGLLDCRITCRSVCTNIFPLASHSYN